MTSYILSSAGKFAWNFSEKKKSDQRSEKDDNS